MVKICPNTYPKDEDTEYSQYFETFPYPLSPFQKYAIEAIVTGQHVLVTAHTGSGKTLPAEFAIQHFVGMGKKVIYTSPIKALSNQKYYEFTNKYPHISFGLFTGDIKTNPDADVLIMTTEILMNYLFVQGGAKDVSTVPNTLEFQIDIQCDLGCVIFDEVHYINDEHRGQVWEKSILMLPQQVQMVMLSATIDNPEGFAQWCEKGLADTSGGKQVWLASTNHRVVPLTHYGFLTTTEAIFKAVKNKDLEKQIREKTNSLIMLRDSKGEFQDSGYRDITKMLGLFENNNVEMKRKHVLNQLALFLRDREMLPAIAFVFSRKHVELCAADITVPLLEDDSKVGYIVRRECEQIVRKLPNYQEYLELPEYNRLVGLLEKGIGIHHSGMIPILREIVELMISKRYIKLLFATESFAIGLDCPIKTAIFTSLTKFDGNGERYLMAHEYTQMAGRAGRRGIDTVGHVIHCNNLFKTPALMDYKTILGGVPQKLVSKFHISYGLILNLLKNGQRANFHEFSQKSMVQQEIMKSVRDHETSIERLRQNIKNKLATISLSKTSRQICESFIILENQSKNSVNKKRKDAEKEMQRYKDEYRSILGDVALVKELAALEADEKNDIGSMEYIQSFIKSQTQNVCLVMVHNGIIEQIDEDYQMTELGKIASNIAEIHPLPLAGLFVQWNYFEKFSAKELVGLFSCFTDVKIPSDMKLSRPNVQNAFLQQSIQELIKEYEKYDILEREMDIRTGIDYDNALIFDMVEFSVKWCNCESETDCKYFIQADLADKEISIGDFTKAMLKIVTISREWAKVCEQIGQISALHKLTQIEKLVLKYVTTCQSLYV
jgi:superfamily II RNA helicase